MNVGWTKIKDKTNRQNHNGLSLADGKILLEEPLRVLASNNHFENGEERILSIGQVLVVVMFELDTDDLSFHKDHISSTICRMRLKNIQIKVEKCPKQTKK